MSTDGGLAGDRLGLADLAAYGTVVLPGCWWLTEHIGAVESGRGGHAGQRRPR